MSGCYRLQVLTQQGLKLDRQVETLRCPGVAGQFGVRPGHAPMIAELTIGELRLRCVGGEEHIMACSGGILEVSREGVVILADAVEEAEEIDVERARQAAERARERVRLRRDPTVDARRAEVALARALNRLKVARKKGL